MNVVYKSLNDKKIDRKSTSVTSRKVRGPDGEPVTVYSFDPNSPTLADDITYIFRQNVKRARRRNKELFGSPDGLPRKP